jgi:predicted site-specific integrase-resolvase
MHSLLSIIAQRNVKRRIGMNKYLRHGNYITELDDIQVVARDKSSTRTGFSVFVHYKSENNKKVEFFFKGKQEAEDFFEKLSEVLNSPKITYYPIHQSDSVETGNLSIVGARKYADEE